MELSFFRVLLRSYNPKKLSWLKSGSDKEPNLDKPCIVGFDVSRSNRPNVISEKPTSGVGSNIYRHPEYKGDEPRYFLLFYDIYGVRKQSHKAFRG